MMIKLSELPEIDKCFLFEDESEPSNYGSRFSQILWNRDRLPLIYESSKTTMSNDDRKPPFDDVDSMLQHVRSRETMTFYELADELSVAPAVVERKFRQETEQAGELEYFIRSALLRQMYYYVPNGVRMHGDWKLIRAISSWVGMVGNTPELESRCKKVGDAVQHTDAVQDNWLPKSAEDPNFCVF